MNPQVLKSYVIKFIIIYILFIAVDIIWLSLYMKNAYKKMIRTIQGQELKIRLYAGVIAYICMTLLYIHFGKNNIYDMFLLGFLAYGIYDMTNYAIFKEWNLTFAVIDMIWGGLLFAAVYIISKYINNIFYIY